MNYNAEQVIRGFYFLAQSKMKRRRKMTETAEKPNNKLINVVCV